MSFILSNLAWASPCIFPLYLDFASPGGGATSKQHSSPQSALIISGSHLPCAPLQAVSTSPGLGRAGLLRLRCLIPYTVCCPAQHNPTKNIPLGRESDLPGGFNHLPLLDFSTLQQENIQVPECSVISRLLLPETFRNWSLCIAVIPSDQQTESC